MHRSMPVLLLALTFAGATSFAAGPAETTKRKIIVTGSRPILDPIRQLVGQYSRDHGVLVTIETLGTVPGLKCVIDKKCEIGMVTEVTNEERSHLDTALIGLNAKAIVTSKDVPVSNLTTAQVKEIFRGKITNWKDVGGPDQAITVWYRSPLTGIRPAFDHFFEFDMKTPQTSEVNSTVELMNRFTQDKNAKGIISYEAMGVPNSESYLKVLSLDGVAPTPENVKNGKYKFVSEFNVVTNKASAGDKDVTDLKNAILALRETTFAALQIFYVEKR